MKANCHPAIQAASRYGVVSLCLFLLLACAREQPQSAPDNGGLSAKIIFPESSGSATDNQGSRALSDSCETYGIAEVVFPVTDTNPENHLAKEKFACDECLSALQFSRQPLRCWQPVFAEILFDRSAKFFQFAFGAVKIDFSDFIYTTITEESKVFGYGVLADAR
jgi:hypothetical protein